MAGRVFSTIVLVGVFVDGTANAEIIKLAAQMDGSKALACNGSGSPATGTGLFTFDTDTLELSYNIVFSGLQGGETMAHVHGPADVCKGGADIIFMLPSGSPKVGTETLDSVAAFHLLDEQFYVNIHSTFEDNGEILGQIFVVPDPGVPATSEWGLIALALVTLTAGTLVLNRSRRSVA